MKIDKLYTLKLQTKTGSFIPAFTNGKTIESKYNPEREAENLLNTIDKKYNFFVILGVGSGLFISKLMEKYPDSFILGIENTVEDINFLKNFDNIKYICENNNFAFSTIEKLQSDLISYYVPALYGNMKIIEILPWINENIQYKEFIKNEINSAIKIVSADFSVQSHFGKIWQKNILNNLLFCNNNNSSIQIKTSKNIAAVIAAGPSLDSKIEYLKKNKDFLYIISTDTAYQTLLKNGIIPEIVVSIDGQFISHEHFFKITESPSTIFAFDLCSNNSAIRHIPLNNFFFFNSGHPLSSFAASNFLKLYSGSGTVTITAFDLAKSIGFNNIQIIGADFSYQNGKPYTKGTYLDSIYGKTNTKLVNQETLFSKLMYRTALIKINENITTTSILESYKTSFEKYISSINFSLDKKDDIYFAKSFENIENGNSKSLFADNSFDFKNFLIRIKSEYNKGNYVFFLPYISNLRSQYPHDTFESLVKLAYSELVSYNNLI